MKQFQIPYHGDQYFIRKLADIRLWREEHGAHTVIFRIYSDDMDEGHVQHVCGILEDEMPDALYLGCTTNANIMEGMLAKPHIFISATLFERESTQAKILQFPFLEGDVVADVEALKQCCDENPWVKAVEMHATIMDMSMMEFCQEMSGLRKDIQVFGGGAFNPDMDDERAFVFSKGNGFLEHGIVFLLLGGEDFHSYSTFISGWKPLKRKFKVTRAEREVLYELDGKPALNIYQRFLNITRNEKFFSNTLEFPLFMEHENLDILRCPLAANEDGSLVMSSDMQEGANVRMAYGDPETILASIREDGQRVADFMPETIQTFSCAARRAFWGDNNISDETVLFQRVAPTSGFYTHGEFVRIDGDMLNFNVTLVIVAMREGDRPAGKQVDIAQAQLENHEKERIPILRRFVAFIEASTADLEEMNFRLAKSSITDGLTALYNRSEIERRIRIALEGCKNYEVHRHISLIMLDIDNFKKINDIYGHKEGDQVIRSIAQVMRDETASLDSCSLGRWGGEEFMVLLMDVSLDETEELANRIRLAFAEVEYDAAPRQTVSVGVTQSGDENADMLYNRVDKALYMAKASGKNRVVRL